MDAPAFPLAINIYCKLRYAKVDLLPETHRNTKTKTKLCRHTKVPNYRGVNLFMEVCISTIQGA